MNRKLKWFVMNCGYAIAIYFALFKNVEHAQNLVLFLVWFSFIMSFGGFLGCCQKKEMHEEIHSNGRSFPKQVSITYDVVEVLLFASFGWTWCAIMVTITSFLQYIIYDVSPDELHSKKESHVEKD